ncbi:MAG: LysR family transcriptional regulator [Oscillibacter sp.]|jgi:DNA-binding transcriptional LysR family regulator|nr:LysR family transcriptional regulator [Oscillibacter sp.]
MSAESWDILLKAIDVGSLSAAANQTNYTTSGISRIIANLEAEIGFPLLVRNHRGISPTKECAALLPNIRNLSHSMELLQQQIAQINGLETGDLTIGTAYSSSYPILTKRVVKFVQCYPNIKVNILWGFNPELYQAVLERRMDVCIVSKRDKKDFLWYSLQEDCMMALVSSTHPLAREDAFPIEAFATENYINIYPGQETDAAMLLSRYGIYPNTRFTTSDRFAAHSMVSAGLGVALLNETQILTKEKGIRILPLNPPQSVEIGMVCLPIPTLATKRFIEFMQETS